MFKFRSRSRIQAGSIVTFKAKKFCIKYPDVDQDLDLKLNHILVESNL